VFYGYFDISKIDFVVKCFGFCINIMRRKV